MLLYIYTNNFSCYIYAVFGTNKFFKIEKHLWYIFKILKILYNIFYKIYKISRNIFFIIFLEYIFLKKLLFI